MITTVWAASLGLVKRWQHIRQVLAPLEAMGAIVTPRPSANPLFGGLESVTTIDLKRTNIRDEDLSKFHHFRRLERLYLPGTAIGSRGLKYLKQNRSLRRLSLWDCSGVGDSSLQHLADLPNLEVLDIHNTRVSAQGIEQVTRFPALEHLTFSPRFSTYKLDWCCGELIQTLANRRMHVSIVGPMFLRNVTDDDLARLANFDVQRVDGVHIADSKLTAKGIDKLQHMSGALSFRSCPLSSSVLDSIRFKNRNRLEFYDSQITPLDLANHLGNRCRELDVAKERCDFYIGQSRRHGRIRIDGSARDFNSEMLRAVPGLRHLECDSECNSYVLSALEEVQPSIHLQIALSADESGVEFWKAIERIPSLTGLEVWNATAEPPRFTTRHQLRHLSLRSYVGPLRKLKPTKEIFQQIGQLSELEWLWLTHSQRAGAEIAPLSRLPKLRFLRLSQIDATAIPILSTLSIEHLSITAAMGAETKSDLRDLPYKVTF